MKRVMTLIGIGIILVTTSCWLPEFNGETLWTYEFNTRLYSPTLGHDGTIYLGTYVTLGYSDTTVTSLCAINPDGTVKWQRADTATSYEGYSSFVVSPNGTVLIGYYNQLLAISPENSDLWGVELSNQLRDIMVDDLGNIYATSADDSLCAYDADGQPLWTTAGVSFLGGIGPDGTIYGFELDYDPWIERLVAVSPDGQIKWSYDSEGLSSWSLAIDDDGTVYICGDKIYALNPDGSMKWSSEEVTYPDCPSIGSDGTLYTGSGPRFCAVADDGSLLWEYSLKNLDEYTAIEWTSPVIGSDGNIYVGVNKIYFIEAQGATPKKHDYLYAFSPEGELLWVYEEVDGLIHCPLLDNDGVLYFCSYEAQPIRDGGVREILYAIQTSSSGLAASPWPRYRGNNQNTGQVQ